VTRRRRQADHQWLRLSYQPAERTALLANLCPPAAATPKTTATSTACALADRALVSGRLPGRAVRWACSGDDGGVRIMLFLHGTAHARGSAGRAVRRTGSSVHSAWGVGGRLRLLHSNRGCCREAGDLAVTRRGDLLPQLPPHTRRCGNRSRVLIAHGFPGGLVFSRWRKLCRRGSPCLRGCCR
jgi:hypothetical protein